MSKLSSEDQEIKVQAEKQENNFEIKNGSVYLNEKLYVPSAKRVQITSKVHNRIGHGGVKPKHSRATGGQTSQVWYVTLSKTAKSASGEKPNEQSLKVKCTILRCKRTGRDRFAWPSGGDVERQSPHHCCGRRVHTLYDDARRDEHRRQERGRLCMRLVLYFWSAKTANL